MSTMIQTLLDYIKTLIGVRQPFCVVDSRNWPTSDEGIKTGAINVYQCRYGEIKPWDMDAATPIITVTNMPVCGAACEVAIDIINEARDGWNAGHAGTSWFDITELKEVKALIAAVLERETIQDVIWYERREDGVLIYQRTFESKGAIPQHIWGDSSLKEYPRVIITTERKWEDYTPSGHPDKRHPHDPYGLCNT
jgi:hypothetical protein